MSQCFESREHSSKNITYKQWKNLNYHSIDQQTTATQQQRLSMTAIATTTGVGGVRIYDHIINKKKETPDTTATHLFEYEDEMDDQLVVIEKCEESACRMMGSIWGSSDNFY
jgi:hypothetical protein